MITRRNQPLTENNQTRPTTRPRAGLVSRTEQRRILTEALSGLALGRWDERIVIHLLRKNPTQQVAATLQPEPQATLARWAFGRVKVEESHAAMVRVLEEQAAGGINWMAMRTYWDRLEAYL